MDMGPYGPISINFRDKIKHRKIVAKIKKSISIRKDLYEEAQAISDEKGISFSQMVTEALIETIARHRNKKLRERINDAYSDDPTLDEKTSLEITKSLQKKLLKEDEW